MISRMSGRSLTINVKNPALGGLLPFEADVFEVAGIPQGVEITLDCSLIVHIPGLGEDSGFDGIDRNAAVAVNPNVGDQILLAEARRCKAATDTRNRLRAVLSILSASDLQMKEMNCD